ncbi:MAG: shikimate dehydrogenase [Propionibacteriaceae bacterium]|jgi:shikimate dehydrogenase|nr:shikimate dehydrogenase [Propionibacteriaceae bacterium]
MPVGRSAIIGCPVDHSLSPALHQAAYDWLGLDWHYGRHQVTVESLERFVASLDSSWRGLSCTAPVKRAVARLGVGDSTVRALGVANTMVFDGRPGQIEQTRVRNTDVIGFRQALIAAGHDRPRSAAVIGNGATAASAIYALAQLGVGQGQVVGRDPAKAADLADRARPWGIDLTPRRLGDRLDPVEVVLSALPAGGAAALEPLAADLVEGAEIVFDVLYDPWPTPLAEAAQAAGRPVISGLDLLARQAVDQVALLSGQTVPVEVFLTAAAQALARRRAERSV